MGKVTMAERIVKVETKLEGLADKLDDHAIEQREDFKKIFDKLDKLGESFAGKWVEKIVLGLLVSIVLSIIGLVLSKVFI